MADNLQDFLRKAAERRAQQEGQSAPAGPPQTPPSQAAPLRPPQQPVQPLQPTQPQPDIYVYESEAVDGEDVSQHVEQHLDTSDFQRRVSRLGSGLIERDQDDRLHDVFDHSVGQLSKDSVTDDAYERKDGDRDYMVDDVDYFDESSTRAKRPSLLTELFSSPKSIRQAFIFSEIIKPPTDRWDP